jgi:hypothetical protein
VGGRLRAPEADLLKPGGRLTGLLVVVKLRRESPEPVHAQTQAVVHLDAVLIQRLQLVLKLGVVDAQLLKALAEGRDRMPNSSKPCAHPWV